MKRGHGASLRIAGIVLATLVAAQAAAAFTAASDAAVKAAFLLNFVKFTEWPALAPGVPIIACVANDDDIASALVTIVRDEAVGGHSIVVSRREDTAMWEGCHVLFVADRTIRRFAASAQALRMKPVLTISDGNGFSKTGGIIELYIEDGRMRFAINVDAADRAGLRLSSRLLGLARVVRDGQ